jgi:2-keto-3-deoxy-6-phosphogluconate aldolase
MKKSEALFKILREHRLIAFLAPKTANDCITAYETLSPMGVILEIAFRTSAAAEGIKATLARYPDALIMAGTVMTPHQAKTAIESGVSGVISADYIPGVVETCVRSDIMCVPGGIGDAGKQLVQKAELYGCDFMSLYEEHPYQWVYKLFPTSTEELSLISLSKAWKAAYTHLQMVYTGGISLKNLRMLVQADPSGIFCGSAVTQSIQDPEQMKREARQWLEIIKNPPENS